MGPRRRLNRFLEANKTCVGIHEKYQKSDWFSDAIVDFSEEHGGVFIIIWVRPNTPVTEPLPAFKDGFVVVQKEA